jgi:serine protease inhibitor
MNSLSEANTKFMLDLFQQLKKPEKNFFCSPLSISSALSMLLLGAQGNTGREIEKVGYPLPYIDLFDLLSIVLSASVQIAGYRFSGLMSDTGCQTGIPMTV